MIALPTLLLALTALFQGRRGGWWIPAALCCSAVGDFAGAVGCFEVQVLWFAAAQGCLAVDMGRCCAVRVRWSVPLVAVLMACGVICCMSMSPIERGGLLLYATLLVSVAGYAALQQRFCRGGYVVAALLFLASDLMIFGVRYGVCSSRLMVGVLPTYYLAQLLYWVLFMRRKRPN